MLFKGTHRDRQRIAQEVAHDHIGIVCPGGAEG